MKTLTTEQLKKMLDSGEEMTLINTLSPENFEQAHIPGSINIPLESADFAEQVEQAAGGKDKRIVVYCASEQCQSSAKAAGKLEDEGFTDVYDYEGGVQSWEAAGEKIEAGV